jgi:large subunit ribosomal protein L18e
VKATNTVLRSTAIALERAGRKKKANVWLVASGLLSSPSSRRVEVNVGRLSRISKEGDVIFVPGKVLGAGELDKKLSVCAFSFSSSAEKKIVSSGGSVVSIQELLKKYPEGSGVRIVR